MRTGIHPEYKRALIRCACGRVSETRATVEELHVEICSHCHPFFTGRQKLVDTAGRVERFIAKYGDGRGTEPDVEPEPEPVTQAELAEEAAAEPVDAAPADEEPTAVEPAEAEPGAAQS